MCFTETAKNGMSRHSLGGEVIFISLQHFILPHLQARGMRDCNKGSKLSRAK